MATLDPRTVERLARIIVDQDGPYSRAGWQLERLLRDSGWPDPPEYDGSFRVGWLVDQIADRRDDQAAVERLLCRVCDPLEYDEGMPVAEEFRRAVNGVLEPERLTVDYVAGRPVLGELSPDGSGPHYTEPPDLEARVRRLVRDEATVAVLGRRIAETRICEHGGAHTMAIIGIGSVVEGLLLALLTERDPDAPDVKFLDNGNWKRNQRPSLASLIDTVHAKGWIQLDAKTFMHNVRDFRNYIHPRKELAELPDFDADSVQLCWSPVRALLNDLEARLDSPG